MRIKDWFTVPEGKKVTEKVFGRVLLSSVCSILLCMVCLASTTWAWFSVSLENKGNEIQIAAATVEVKVNDTTLDANGDSCTVNAGAHTVAVKRTSYDGNKPVYVVLAVKSSASEGTENTELNYYWIQAEPVETKVNLDTKKAADISYGLSWVKPDGATDLVSVEIEEPTDGEQTPEEEAAEEETVEDSEDTEEVQPSDGEADTVDTPKDENDTETDENNNGTTGEESGGETGGEPEVAPDVEIGGGTGDAVGDNTGADPNDVSGTETSGELNPETTQTSVPETSTDTPVDTPAVTPTEPSAEPQTETVPEEPNTSE